MSGITVKIHKALYVVENAQNEFSTKKFLKFCEIVKREILTAFEERNLTKDEAKILLRRVNLLLDFAEEKEEYTCPRCGIENKEEAHFCAQCEQELQQ